ncbi:hypothetical protein K450DRAFT_236589 [Umbelopsis ramanniana AG]|uniref:CCR4-NOT transcription complex subunit 4 n=1 Tax=Umbelopsis ramanniana AG TaxID=1314678 RepID=A0AAD5EE81_UMBRA|nr:uncharacterized protein K450DRAFT_236589 [Umbelopsis ramanniana AG]KAI8580645.1 hypothetical protein K450DRAFT_236589 [Umbelopsis ramanniana AG]
MSDVDDYDCPLCMEELDLSDRNFRPCPCGYQICRFCWHHIRENLNGRCPACRRLYSEQTVEFTPISSDEIVRLKKEKKEKERQQKEMEQANRRHLENTRVVQKNLVYVIGLNPKYANEETIMSQDFFGQYGKISKIVINKRPPPPSATARHGAAALPSVGVYVTYCRKDDAARAIAAVDGSVMGGRMLRASYGTTKYCSYYLRNMACQNPVCMYLHDLGDDADSFSKEELAVGKQNLRDHISSEVDSKPQVLGQHARPPTPADFPPMMSSYQSGRRPATLESVAHIQFKNKQLPTVAHPNDSGEDVSAANSEDEKSDEKSALPATVSWATGSGPNTPNLKSASLPLTPDNFGPSLAAAAAAAAQAKQQAKAKANKKRNKDKLEVGSQTSAVDDESKSTSDGHVPQLVSDSGEEAENEMDEMEFTQYVLGGNHFQRLLSISDKDAEDMEDEVVGIQALRDDPQPAEDEPVVADLIKDSEPVSTFSILKTSLSPYSSTGYVGPFNPFAKDEPALDDMASLESLRKTLPDIRTSPTMHMSPVRNHLQSLPHNVPMHAPPQPNILGMQAGGGKSPQAANAFLQALQHRQPLHHANPMVENMMGRPDTSMRGPPPGISHPPNLPDSSHARLSPQAFMHLNILNNAAVQPEMSMQQSPVVTNNGHPNMMSPHRKPSEASVFQDTAIMALGNQVVSPMFNDDNQAPEARRLRVFQGLRNTEPSFTPPVANNSNDIRAGLAALLNGANYPGKLSNTTPNNVAPL